MNLPERIEKIRHALGKKGKSLSIRATTSLLSCDGSTLWRMRKGITKRPSRAIRENIEGVEEELRMKAGDC